ncbi:MAG TPA: glycosyltransferase family 2 protein [Ramlibacter sp.]|jgi:glycosyltransferase involved in cell wall biosynthesis|uniref:glycosyltransferase family 2 protein n=1 Tax=Ramlibacter sp. TaxID=1917967 RepID=UPI002D5A7A0A|nr:glycosyltransferase family 2 protein [Ramlibacter sp.]HZY18482.1 glycosyltransferase family 2 protein [Ramlibacter sp.]
MPSLSIVIVAKNEAQNIADCVRSARFADEVVVLDSGSTDGTADLARAEGARVIVTADWPGYGPQNNRGIDASTGDWFFSLDADERITPALAAEIRQAIERTDVNGFRVPRLSMYCGRFMRHGGWRPDYTRRLARRGQGRFTEHFLHANLQVQGPVGTLRESIVHYSFRTMDGVLEKLNRYSSASARDMTTAGRKGSLGKAVVHGLWAFFRTYVLRLGFLDGRWGFMLAVSNAEGTYYRYVKLWLMQRGDAQEIPRP